MSDDSSIPFTEVIAALGHARTSLAAWTDTPVPRRVEIASAFAEQLKSHKGELGLIISEETGKPRWESATEVDAMIGKVALSVRAMEERRRPTETTIGGVTAATRYKPHGVVAVLGPFNFPGHLPNGHIVPALLAGNTVIFKPSEHTPRTARKTVEIWSAAGLPEGVLNLVEGGPETGKFLISAVDGVFFTGSFEVGRAISRALADTPGKIAALEMGGNNPLVVHRVGDVRAAAYLTIQSAYLSAGQRCSCARRLIVIDDEAPAFIEALLAMMKRIRVGLHTDDPEPFMGPVINGAAAEKLLAAQENLIGRGAKPLARMSSLRGITQLLSPGLLDVTDVRQPDPEDEELFGPLLQLIRVPHFESAIRRANRTSFGLAAGLLSDDRTLWDEFYRDIRAGVVNWNRPLTGASSALPFGGVGDSGNHRPSAYFAADYCSYPVASLEIERVAMPEKLSPGIEL
ncbi:MAG: succinylglutamic semialdehyde dehydrogenase [Phycisphaerales bacterium]|jgi:succinylglutamic semialdehyde dehydrogenase|nr:succinylglutamic semialdehyde dehydrogenase [Phycisphaerales bacterium]